MTPNQTLRSHLLRCERCRNLELNTRCEIGVRLMARMMSRAEIRRALYQVKKAKGEV